MKFMSKAQRKQYLERALGSIATYDVDEAPSPRQAREFLKEEFDISVPFEVVRDYQAGAITAEELELGDDGVVREVQPAR